MRVCSAFFFMFCTTVQIELILIETEQKHFSVIRVNNTGAFFAFVLFVVREQTTTDVNIGQKVAKDGVHVCVLRFFLFFLSHHFKIIIYLPHNTTIKEQLYITLVVLFFFVVDGCARIDNNRREYCVLELHSCAYMRVCSAFFSFVVSTFSFITFL